jgi:small GTP-binding protein
MDSNSIKLTLKLVILGDAFVGKTSLVSKFMGKDFSKRYQKTFGSDISFKNVEIEDSNNKKYNIFYSVWDIYGEASYDELTKQFLLGTQSIVIMYDVGNKDSFINISKWITTASKSMNMKNIPIILVGNKIDLRSENGNTITTEEGIKLLNELNSKFDLNPKYFHFIETSALDGTNIRKVFDLISEIIINYMIIE